MPCRDYDDYSPSNTISDYQAKFDRLSRIACRALESLEKADDGSLEALILKDPETAEWWAAHKEADRKARAEVAAKRKAAAEKAALTRRQNEIKAKLTPEEIKILGLK